MAALAQELIDAIVEEIEAPAYGSTSNKETLKACAVVARTFLAPTQRRIFRTLIIKSVDKAKILVEGLSHSPHLGTYVHDLTHTSVVIPATRQSPPFGHRSLSAFMGSKVLFPAVQCCIFVDVITLVPSVS
ncbi:hypothetical protein B0H14DRAFT_2597263 [Mycena olivaceomarginata]|nr:hypothetical protein B0H14DRAFT_2597263 [Mycena olivaceomarginata]